MLLSIIIPAYNEAKLIGHTLGKLKQALAKQQESDWEVILCDNNSSDNTAKIAAQEGAKVIFEAFNQISKARNTGASATKVKWLLFLDADSYPDEKLINEVFRLIDDNKIIGAGATLSAVNGPLWNRLRIERLNFFMPWLNWSGGAFILCKQEAFKQIGGFSEDLFALEEIEFIYRLKAWGKSLGKGKINIQRLNYLK